MSDHALFKKNTIRYQDQGVVISTDRSAESHQGRGGGGGIFGAYNNSTIPVLRLRS